MRKPKQDLGKLINNIHIKIPIPYWNKIEQSEYFEWIDGIIRKETIHDKISQKFHDQNVAKQYSMNMSLFLNGRIPRRKFRELWEFRTMFLNWFHHVFHFSADAVYYGNCFTSYRDLSTTASNWLVIPPTIFSINFFLFMNWSLQTNIYSIFPIFKSIFQRNFPSKISIRHT